MSQLAPEMSSLWHSVKSLQEWQKRRRSVDLARFFCEPARRNDYDMRKAEVDFIKESGRLGNVYFYEDIQRWAPGDLAVKMAERLEQEEDFVVVMCTSDGLRLRDPSFAECSKDSCKTRCQKHEEEMRKAKVHIDGGFRRVTVEDVLAATGATLCDFEVRGTPDDDVTSQRARLRATEYARIGLVEKGFTVGTGSMNEVDEHGHMHVCRPPGPVTIRLPPPFDDSEIIASSTPLGAILKSASPEGEVAKRLRCVEQTLAIARSKLCEQCTTIKALEQKLVDKTLLLEQQAKELQKTQKELAEHADSVQRAITGMDQLHPPPSASTGQCERDALHRQLGQRVGAMLRQVENGAKSTKKLDAATQKLRGAEQDLQESRKAMETIKTENAIRAGEVGDLKSTIAVLKARVAELTASNAQLDNLERLVECVVCKDRYVEVVFHCGHTTCSPCGERLALNDEPCPSCQQKLGYRKKLFLGS